MGDPPIMVLMSPPMGRLSIEGSIISWAHRLWVSVSVLGLADVGPQVVLTDKDLDLHQSKAILRIMPVLLMEVMVLY